jgi:HSP20 family protein
MTLVRWRPMKDMISMQRDLNRAFNDFFSTSTASNDLFERDWAPAVDIFEKDDEVNLKAELPGMTREDISISIENSTLTISGEKKRENEVSDDNYHRIERSYGRFQRAFSLPSTVDSQNVKANFKDGILSITLAKKEEAKPKKIEVAVS